MLEHRQHQGPQVPLVQVLGALSQVRVQVEVLEPNPHQVGERAVGVQVADAGDDSGAVSELDLQLLLRGR
jgi:hypothetical protein